MRVRLFVLPSSSYSAVKPVPGHSGSCSEVKVHYVIIIVVLTSGNPYAFNLLFMYQILNYNFCYG